MYRNCFGIKNGSIAPCPKVGRNRMCIYETFEESFAAWEKIWIHGYGNKFPTLAMAATYSGGDGYNWLSKVTYYYRNPSKLKI